MAHRILVIDDAESLHRLIAHGLADDDIEVFGALDGTSGIRKAQQIKPDVILLDVLMPGLNGYDVCELLSILPETAGTPIIFLSSVSEVYDRVHGLNLGAADYIPKPFELPELRARVRVQLRQKAMLDREAWRAQHDALTGLWCRGYFDKRFNAEISMAQHQNTPLSLIMADVDHFKLINDHYGHEVGDDVLREVAAVFNADHRRDDVACRYGGEEFVILCPGIVPQTAALIAERLRARIEGMEIQTPRGYIKVTCSFGISTGEPAQELLSTADWALYEAKRLGRNRVVVPDSALCHVYSHARAG